MRALHSSDKAKEGSSECNVAPVLWIAIESRAMLTTNLWVEAGLTNGAMGTVVDIVYAQGTAPPALPTAVYVRFEGYTGPSCDDGPQVVSGQDEMAVAGVQEQAVVKIEPIAVNWGNSKEHGRTQISLRLCDGMTIHKSQGLTLDKAVVDVGDRENSGLTFVACSRVRESKDIALVPGSDDRFLKCNQGGRLQERLIEGVHSPFLSTLRYT